MKQIEKTIWNNLTSPLKQAQGESQVMSNLIKEIYGATFYLGVPEREVILKIRHLIDNASASMCNGKSKKQREEM